VVGYGNTVRGDDGLGPCIVAGLQDVVASCAVEVHTVVVPQLDVTLAAELTAVPLVIFVDAREDADEEAVKVQRVFPAALPLTLRHTSHSVGIPDLLRMALEWFGARPVCYAVLPKGYAFAFSERLSPNARRTARQARSKIVEIIRACRSGSLGIGRTASIENPDRTPARSCRSPARSTRPRGR
jgi:hydrogenase maturation protease